MNINQFKGTFNQLVDNGREILKNIENFKFELDQVSRITKNDAQLTQKLVQKQKALDIAASQIYGIVFDIENADITQMYADQQMVINNPNINTIPDGEPTNNVNMPALDQMTEPDVDQELKDQPLPEETEETAEPDQESESEDTDTAEEPMEEDLPPV